METPGKWPKKNVKKSNSMKADTSKNLAKNLDKLNFVREEILYKMERYNELEEKIKKLENGEDVEYEGKNVDGMICDLQTEKDEIEDRMWENSSEMLDEFDCLDFDMAKLLVDFPNIWWEIYYVEHCNKFWKVNSKNIEERKSLLKKIIDKDHLRCHIEPDATDDEWEAFYKAFKWCLDNDIALYILNKSKKDIDELKDGKMLVNSIFFNSNLEAFLKHMDKFHWLSDEVFKILFDICENGKYEKTWRIIVGFILKNIDSFDCFSDEEKREFREIYEKKGKK